MIELAPFRFLVPEGRGYVTPNSWNANLDFRKKMI